MQTVAEALIAAIQHQQAARYPEAEAFYRAVLDQEPDQPQALYLYGLLKLHTDAPRKAVDLLARAAALRPAHAATRLNLARALLAAHRPAEVLEQADAILIRDPALAEAHYLRGTALNALDRAAEAVPALERAIALDPTIAAAHLNLGNAHADLDDLAAAEAHCRAAIARDPALVEAHASLGFILTSRGRLQQAMAACAEAIRLAPDYADAHWNLAVAALLAGDFTLGFEKYEWRKRHDRFHRDFLDLPGPVWHGENLAGRTLLVNAEQGLGDTIQLARYLPLIAEAGGRPVLACDPSLTGLLATLPGVATVAKTGQLPPCDFWIDQMSLPRVFATLPDTIPCAAGYLSADPARVAAWRARLPHGKKIGIVWAGNPAHSNDRRRSLPPAALARILAVPGIEFVSLQVGPRARETALKDNTPLLRDYAETAALIENLDLVIAIDTSVAHLAGALGKPCWLLLPFAPDWRWLDGRDDTPWYSSLRLFRQPAPGDWDSVAGRVALGLAAQ
jgi:tetratricopeptide (TPR) repeat protein